MPWTSDEIIAEATRRGLPEEWDAEVVKGVEYERRQMVKRGKPEWSLRGYVGLVKKRLEVNPKHYTKWIAKEQEKILRQGKERMEPGEDIPLRVRGTKSFRVKRPEDIPLRARARPVKKKVVLEEEEFFDAPSTEKERKALTKKVKSPKVKVPKKAPKKKVTAPKPKVKKAPAKKKKVTAPKPKVKAPKPSAKLTYTSPEAFIDAGAKRIPWKKLVDAGHISQAEADMKKKEFRKRAIQAKGPKLRYKTIDGYIAAGMRIPWKKLIEGGYLSEAEAKQRKKEHRRRKRK